MKTKIFALAALALTAAFLTAFPAKAEDKPAPATQSELVVKTGVVGLMGNEPFVKISFIEDGTSQTFELSGYYAAEFKKLGGAKVKITALKPKAAEGVKTETISIELEKLTVVEYEIVDVGGGVKPYVGVLLEEGGAFKLLVSGLPEPIKLAPGGEQMSQLLSKNAGAKVWIAGKTSDKSGLTPTRIKVLRKAQTGK